MELRHRHAVPEFSNDLALLLGTAEKGMDIRASENSGQYLKTSNLPCPILCP